MSKVLVKTEYNWADEIGFPSWEVWDNDEYEKAKEEIKEYWENGGKQFHICVGTNEDVDFYDLDSCLGSWCHEGATALSDRDAKVLERLFKGSSGNLGFSRVVERIKR